MTTPESGGVSGNAGGTSVWGLVAFPAASRTDLVAEPVAAALRRWSGPVRVEEVLAAPIDPSLAETADFCAAYGVPMQDSANCVVVAGKRAGRSLLAAIVVPATTRADINGVVRRRLNVRKASFAPREEAERASGMEYGGITPLGLSAEWPLLVDSAAAAREVVVVGSGRRRSKIVLPGRALASLPGAQIVEGLASPAA